MNSTVHDLPADTVEQLEGVCVAESAGVEVVVCTCPHIAAEDTPLVENSQILSLWPLS